MSREAKGDEILKDPVSRKTAVPNPNEPLRSKTDEDDPSCSLLIMRRGRSLDERLMATAEPRRRTAVAAAEAKGMLKSANKSSSMSNMTSKELPKKMPAPPKRKKSKVQLNCCSFVT